MQLIVKEELGEWTGQSPGRDQMDLSLQVKNRRVAGACVQQFLIREHPDRDYWLASSDQAIFDA